MVKKRKSSRKMIHAPMIIGEDIIAYLEKIGGNRQKSRLSALWENWGSLMGEEIAEKTLEIHAREKTLILKTHDAFCMQELGFLKEFMLETANAFLGSHYFEKISLII